LCKLLYFNNKGLDASQQYGAHVVS
jgi:hypothetical protein